MPAYRSLGDVVDGFAELERGFLARHDRRAIFLTLYGVVSTEMHARVANGSFADATWVERYAVAFANLYREALEAYDAGRRDAVPDAWRLCFDAAASGAGLVLQDVLLGVNAHVTHDLAFALDRVSIEPDREARRRDHDRVNGVLSAVTDRATQRLASLYAPGLATLDDAAGELDEVLGRLSLTVARDRAWESACDLADARGSIGRGLATARLSARSAVLAKLLLAPSKSPAVMAACRRLERELNWSALIEGLGRA
jgi:hypothetical protein